jgi:hypothetical protein
MINILLVSILAFLPAVSFAKTTNVRKPASIVSTVWETRQIPIGKACPYQAQRYDEIAYQANGDGSGYVCFMCDYRDDSPLLLVTEQSTCSKSIKCRNGKCE